jgi:hypothetical protein
MSSSTAVPFPSPVPLPEPDPSFLAPEQYEDLAAEVASFVASLALPCDHNWTTLNSAPFRIISRGPLLTSIVFDDGRSRVMDTAAVDAYLRVTTHMPAPPLQPPSPLHLPPLVQLSPESVGPRHQARPPSPLLSPTPSPAFAWRPSWQPARPPTPYHEPVSPPTPLPTYSPHRDITYQHGASGPPSILICPRPSAPRAVAPGPGRGSCPSHRAHALDSIQVGDNRGHQSRTGTLGPLPPCFIRLFLHLFPALLCAHAL